MSVLQFESIANFGAVIDRLGEFQEVLESSATSRSTGTDTSDAQTNPTQAPSLIQLVDHPGDNRMILHLQAPTPAAMMQDISLPVALS